ACLRGSCAAGAAGCAASASAAGAPAGAGPVPSPEEPHAASVAEMMIRAVRRITMLLLVARPPDGSIQTALTAGNCSTQRIAWEATAADASLRLDAPRRRVPPTSPRRRRPTLLAWPRGAASRLLPE